MKPGVSFCGCYSEVPGVLGSQEVDGFSLGFGTNGLALPTRRKAQPDEINIIRTEGQPAPQRLHFEKLQQ